MGYVVQPLASCAVRVRPSAVRGARHCAISGVAGFVVLSRRAGAVMCERGPSRTGRGAHHETREVDSKLPAPLALVQAADLIDTALVFAPNSRTTSPCGGC